MFRTVRSYVLLPLILALCFVGASPVAHATNKNTVSGNDTTACAVTWTATTRYNDPALATDLNGNPVDATNGGFATEVSPGLGDPGHFELQHFVIRNQIYWRLPIASTYSIYNASITFTADPAMGTVAPVQLTPFDYAHRLAAGGDTSLLDLFPNEFTLPGDPTKLGTIPAKSHSTQSYLWVQTLTAPFNAETIYTATATLTGTYAMGAGCESSVPPAPEPKDVDACSFYTYGRTTWPLGSPDITTREKYDADGSPATEGEINADGWGMPKPTLRLYAATDVELNNVELKWWPTQGFAFTPNSFTAVVTGSSTGMGTLYGQGYVNPADGIGTPTLNPDGSVTLTVTHMPANSAIAFNVGATLDGSYETLSMNETMTGKRADLMGCTPRPEPKPTEYSAWTDTATFTCGMTSVPITRTVTTYEVVWNSETNAWEQKATQTVENGTRPVTDAEAGTCTKEPTVTYGDWVEAPIVCGDATATSTRTVTTVSYVYDKASGDYVPQAPVVTTETKTRTLTSEERQAVCEMPAPIPSTYTAWVVVKKPTCTATGSQTRTRTDYEWVWNGETYVKQVKATTTETQVIAALVCVTKTYQVDRYTWYRTYYGKKIAAFDNDGLLKYGEDRWMYTTSAGIKYTDSRWQIVSVRVPKGATASQIRAAINAKTTSSIGDIRTSYHMSSAVRSRGSVTIAWEVKSTSWLIKRSTRGPQYFFGRS